MILPSDLATRPVPAFLFDRERSFGDRPRFVVRSGDTARVVTWTEHARTVRRLARFLAARGIGKGQRVAVFAGNSVAAIAAALAIQAAGATTLFVHASSTAEQAAYCIRHGGARLAFVDDERSRRLNDAGVDVAEEIVSLENGVDARVGGRTTRFQHALANGRSFDDADPEAFERTLESVALEDVAILLYTSGTTGEPKGVPLTHRNLVLNWAEWLSALAPVIPDDPVDLLWLPITHVFGLGEVLIGDALGFTSHLVDARNAVQELATVRPNVFLSVPAVWEKIAARVQAEPVARRQRAFRELTGGRLSLCLSGGAALKREVKEVFSEHGTLLLEGYGLSETSPTLTVNRPDAFRFDSVGKPLPSVELRLAPDGEVLARGPTVFAGYFRDAAATRASFDAEGWFKTGDVGRITEGGFLQLVDRKKDLIVTAGGKNVAPTAIETRFRDDPFVKQIVVYGEGKKYLVAAVWPDDELIAVHLDAQALEAEERGAARRALLQQRIDRVNGQLASHETIKKFVVATLPLTIESGLVTPSLKVKRRAVWERMKAVFESLYLESTAIGIDDTGATVRCGDATTRPFRPATS